MAYLEKNYPGQRIVLSDKYETNRGLSNDIRIWTFTLSDYPKDTFHVASYINSYPFPMMKNQHGIIDDFEEFRCSHTTSLDPFPCVRFLSEAS